MMVDVPKVDATTTNPTYYSVTLKYDENKTSALKIVAKGTGLVVLRIREISAGHHVPTLEMPSLAYTLYRHAEISQRIPG